MSQIIENKKSDILKIKFEHKLWQHDLNFKQEEIELYFLQLDKLYYISNRNPNYYQAQKYRTLLYKQIEVLQSLKASIAKHEQEILNQNNTETSIRDHTGSRNAFVSYDKIYREMMQDVKHFLMDSWAEQNA